MKRPLTEVKGYKVFNPDWTCLDYQYTVGKTYRHQGEIALCSSGFHFCEHLLDCFNYYGFNPNNKVAEVLASGHIISGEDKSVTNTLKIVKELTWDEVLNLVNTGKCNAGCRNAGNCNTGDWNTGDCNTGNWNTGNCNTGCRNAGNWNTGNWNIGNRNAGGYNIGDRNTGTCNAGKCNTGTCNAGNWNTGNYNTGNWNTGNWNTGNCNTGNWNTGMFNSCDYSNGLFNSEPPKIYLFNKPTKLTFEQFKKKYSEAYHLLYYTAFNLTEWIADYEMTDEEKEVHPEYKTIKGYLKRYSYKDACQKMWDSFDKQQHNKIKKLPNFDKEIFKNITGIEV